MSTKNLKGTEAIEKLKELAEDARTCMMLTSLDERPIPTRPMSVQEVSSDGKLWFISSKSSDKNYDISKDSEVHLTFANSSSMEYLSIYGVASIYTDQEHIDEYWSEMANAWFDGKSDPDVSIIGVDVKDAFYWETKNGKIVSMAKHLYSAVTGNKVEEGNEGNLSV